MWPFRRPRFSRPVCNPELLLDRCNRLLSAVYIALVLALLSAITHLYFTHLYHLVHQNLSPHHAMLHTLLSLYLLISVAANYLICLFTSGGSPPRTHDPEATSTLSTMPSTKSTFNKINNNSVNNANIDTVVTRSETWRVCALCRATKPPRAHHCSACGVCILRLCHHCPALGRCIGRDNYPYFFRFVTLSTIGSFYASATCWMLRTYTSPLSHDGRLFAIMIAGMAITVATGVLSCWHVYLVLTAQTTVEWLENFATRRAGAAPAAWGRWGGPFGKGGVANLREAFGEGPRLLPWWVTLMLPLRRVAAWEGEVY